MNSKMQEHLQAIVDWAGDPQSDLYAEDSQAILCELLESLEAESLKDLDYLLKRLAPIIDDLRDEYGI